MIPREGLPDLNFGLGDYGGATYSCTEQQLAEVLSLVGAKQDLARAICTQYDCSVSTSICVLQYLTNAQLKLGDAMNNTASRETELGLDVMFVLFSAFLVFNMQLGFALLCAGAIRSKNSMNILLKNILDACVGAIGFYLFGYAFAYGHKLNETSNKFIGNWNFALSYTKSMARDDLDAQFDGFALQGWHSWFFQWSFCATATTIVSGAMAERTTFGAYLSYAFFISSFVYPVIVHWVWSPDGWLSALNTSAGGNALILKTGAIDFSGSGVVHMVGGWAGLLGAWVIGPRIGRFDASGKVNDMKGHSATLIVMGAFLLWFGFFGFNPGSNQTISSLSAAIVVSRIAVVTALGGASAGITTLLYKYVMTGVWDTVTVCNGVLAGLVSIASGCSVIEPWAAIIAGGVGSIIFCWAEWFCLYKMKVDDPVSAWALHGVTGMWGVLFTGLLAQPQYVEQVYGSWASFGLAPAIEGKRYGILYGGHGQLLLCQFIEVVVIIAWVGFMMGTFFYAFKVAKLLRVSVEAELSGLDLKTGGSTVGATSFAADAAALAAGLAAQQGMGGGMGSNMVSDFGTSMKLAGSGMVVGASHDGQVMPYSSTGER